MGYETRPGIHGHTIRTFWPDDTDTEFFLCGTQSLTEIIELVKEKWPGIDLDDINIEPQNIHTDCLGYDLYDSSDYTNFIRISKIR